MNETLRTIASRRSVRSYKKEQIKDEELQAILEAGLQAPSGHNDQSWYFTVIQNKKIIQEINDGAKSVMRSSATDWVVHAGNSDQLHIFYHAPTIILVSAKNGAVSPMPDTCAAIENIFIAAESLKIGSCWIGFARYFFENGKNHKESGIPEGYTIQNTIALGYKPDTPLLSPPARKYEKYFDIIK